MKASFNFTELRLTLQLIYIRTVAAPLLVQILCRVDHCMQRRQRLRGPPRGLTTQAASSSPLRLITALWPHVLPSRNNYSRDASPSAIDIVHLPRLLPQTLGGVVWTLRRSQALQNLRLINFHTSSQSVSCTGKCESFVSAVHEAEHSAAFLEQHGFFAGPAYAASSSDNCFSAGVRFSFRLLRLLSSRALVVCQHKCESETKAKPCRV